MKTSVAILSGLLVSIQTFASGTLQRDYPITLNELAKIEEIVKRFESRSEEMRPYMVMNVDDDRFVVVCPAHLPTAEGKGCLLSFTFDFPGVAKITVVKELQIYGQVEEMKAKLAVSSAGPGEHVQLGTIFTEASSEGSHVFCVRQAAGAEARCTLSLIEQL